MEKKKVKKNKVSYRTAEQDELIKFGVVVLVLAVIIAGVYFGTRAFVTKDLFTSDEGESTEVVPGTVNYEVAIMGQILNRPEKEYYVAIYNQVEGDYITDMLSLVYEYSSKKESLPIYSVDLSNKLNEGYYDPENVNVKAQKLDEMKVGDITLLKIKKGKISKYIVDYAKMQKELGIKAK